MKYFVPLAMFGTALIATSAPAQMVGSQPGGNNYTYNRDELQQIYAYRLKTLRTEALRRQAADGGTLSPASQAYLQAKLDRINATRVRDARNNDLSSVDASGIDVRSQR